MLIKNKLSLLERSSETFVTAQIINWLLIKDTKKAGSWWSFVLLDIKYGEKTK